MMPFYCGRAVFPLAFAQALSPLWARAQRVRTLGKCSLLKRLIYRLFNPSAVDAFAQCKLYGILLRRSLCRIVSQQFDLAGRCAISVEMTSSTRTVGAREESHSIAVRRDTHDGRRTRQRV